MLRHHSLLHISVLVQVIRMIEFMNSGEPTTLSLIVVFSGFQYMKLLWCLNGYLWNKKKGRKRLHCLTEKPCFVEHEYDALVRSYLWRYWYWFRIAPIHEIIMRCECLSVELEEKWKRLSYLTVKWKPCFVQIGCDASSKALVHSWFKWFLRYQRVS